MHKNIIKGDIWNLVFEITRRCNMKCKHCLNGDAQNIDMTFEIIDKVLSQIKQINRIVITGGEPTLYHEAINYILNRIIHYNIDLNYFFIKTNGKIYNAQFVEAINKLHAYSNRKYECELVVSLDQFHSKVKPSILEKYKNTVNCRFTAYSYVIKEILKDGNALINDIGTYYNIRSNRIRTFIFNGHFIVPNNDTLYINALGDVLTKCDYSFSTQRISNLGNVLQKPIVQILKESEKVDFIVLSKKGDKNIEEGKRSNIQISHALL